MYVSYIILRILLFPWVRYFFPLFNKKAYARMEFELRNLGAVKPFDKAKFGFEISSQGELEQVKVLLISILPKQPESELIKLNLSGL